MKPNFMSRFPMFVGFDDIFNTMEGVFDEAQKKGVMSNWPPYNVIKSGDNTYKIQLAIAGFSSTDVDVELDGNTLRVKGEVKADPSVEYLTKGIAERSFTRTFTLADSVKVEGAEMINGVLNIILEHQAKATESLRKIAVK